MKYNILINQYQWSELVPDADIVDATVFDAIQFVCNTQNLKMVRTDDGYTWIALQMIIDQNPILKINSKSSISKRISFLENEGLIKTKIDAGRLFVKIEEKALALEMFQKGDRPKNELAFLLGNDTVSLNERDRFFKETNNIDSNNIDKDNITNKEKKLKRSYSRKRQEVETLPENEYISKVNSFFANPDFRKKITEKIPVWKEMGVPDVKQNLLMAKEWLLNNTTSDKQRGESNGSFMRFLNQWMINASSNSKKTIIHEMKSYEKPKPVNAPSYSYTPEQIAEIEAQFNQSFKE